MFIKKFIILLLILIFSCSSIENIKKSHSIKCMYYYIADTGIFIDCKTQKKHPIAMEADNISLERAYLKMAENPVERILVTLTGYVKKRPKIEGDGEIEFLVVSKLDKIWPNINCKRNLGIATLQNIFWALQNLNGISIEKYKFERNINLVLQKNNSIKGFSGCNNFFGKYTILSDTLKFTNVGKTLKNCNDNMDIEQKFFQLLEETIVFKIYGEYLFFYNKNKLIAKFESVYFN